MDDMGEFDVREEIVRMADEILVLMERVQRLEKEVQRGQAFTWIEVQKEFGDHHRPNCMCPECEPDQRGM